MSNNNDDDGCGCFIFFVLVWIGFGVANISAILNRHFNQPPPQTQEISHED